MSATTENAGSPRLPLVERETIDDPELRVILARSDELSAPKAAWYLALAHDPPAAKLYASYWDGTHRGGRVEHTTKELMRLAIVQLLGCDFCAGQRSVDAQRDGLEEADVQACSMPDFDPPDPRLRAALRYARALALDHAGADTAVFDEVYADLREVFDDGEVVELACFAALTIGGTKVARSMRLM